LGATISGAEAATIELLRQFGMKIGTAYQIYDDCLDLAGTEAATGKTLGTDLIKGKFTLPVLIFLQAASEFERERCSTLIVEERSDEVTELLKNAATNGALNSSITTATELIHEAQATLCLPWVRRSPRCSINCGCEFASWRVELLRDLLPTSRELPPYWILSDVAAKDSRNAAG